jgi:hypothetical protein
VRADGLTEGRGDKAKKGGACVKIPSLSSQRTDTRKMTDRHIPTMCQCVIKKQEARHEFQKKSSHFFYRPNV